MNQGQYSVFNAMVDIVAAPGKALDEVKNRTGWLWWPLAVNILFTIAVFVFYFMWVDFDWLIDETIRASVPPGGDPAIADQIRSFMSPGTQIATTSVFIVIMVFLIYAIQSAYLHLVNKVVGDPALGFGHWFSFSAWTGFVGIFNALAILVVLLMSDSNQVGQEELAPLSLQSLFMHAESGSAWATWGSSLTLVHIWILVIMAIGFMRWTGSSAGKSAAIVTAPWVVIFGAWALMIS